MSSSGGGYYRMHRGWMDGKMFANQRRDPFDRRSAWTWMIERAPFEGPERGRFSHSMRYLAEAWGWSLAKVFRYLQACVSEEMIACSTETGQVTITICNYDKYQYQPSVTETQPAVAVEQQRNAAETDIKEGKEGKKEDTSLSGGVDVAREMLAIWNGECGDILNQAERLTSARAQKCKLRLKDVGGDLETWRDICRRIRRSQFLTERWKASIDWVLEPTNLLKIQEGNYDDRAIPLFGKTGRPSPHDAETAAFAWAAGGAVDSGPDSPDDAPLLDAAGAF